MSEYFDYTTGRLVPATLARSTQVNSIFDSVSVGLDKLPTEDELKFGKTQTGTESGAANAYVITLPYTPASLTEAMYVRAKITVTNTSATVSLNVDSLGAKTVTLQDGTAPSVGDLKAGYYTTFMYNAVTDKYEIQNITPAIIATVAGLSAATSGSGALVSANDTTLGYLNGKLIKGIAPNVYRLSVDTDITASLLSSVRLIENNDGGAETLSIGSGTPMFTNRLAVVPINLSLPAGESGYEAEFEVMAAQYLKVTADGSEVFSFNGVDTAAGGYVRSNAVGTAWRIRWNETKWAITIIAGVLKYDE